MSAIPLTEIWVERLCCLRRKMLTYIKSAVTRNASEKKINSLLDFVGQSPNLKLLQASSLLRVPLFCREELLLRVPLCCCEEEGEHCRPDPQAKAAAGKLSTAAVLPVRSESPACHTLRKRKLCPDVSCCRQVFCSSALYITFGCKISR